MTPDRVPFAEIVAQLRDQPDLVIDRCCDLSDAWREPNGDLWCRSPLRADRRPGSFVIHTRGGMAGRWKDFGTGAAGDMFDLLRQAENCDQVSAIQIAKALLGLAEMTETERRQAEARAREREAKRQAAERAAADERARRERAAAALWLSCSPDLVGTPVAGYLAARGIDLGALPRTPSVIRYHPGLAYAHTDRETGEVVEGVWPAMVCAITGTDGRTIGAHRTWLACHNGRWGKAPVPRPKKVLGSVKHGLIRLWSGIEADGRKGVPLAQARPGAAVMIAEGVENALSAVVLRPEARVVAAVSLSNFAAPLPVTIGAVTLIADNDAGPEQRAAFDQAVARHARAGRLVRVWRATPPHKDLNDELQAALAAAGGVHAA